MQRLQAELRKAKVLFNIEIVGVNAAIANIDSYNQLVSFGNPLPWLQDTSTNRVWQNWGVTYRDLRILDSSNRVAAVFNLTSHDLGDSENYEVARALFLNAANSGDSNRNGLPDAWEAKYFGGMPAERDGDSDADGYSNFVEFAFGTDPRDSSSHPNLSMTFTPDRRGFISFPRWAGTTLDFVVETSTNVNSWSASASLLRGVTTNLFDGSGRMHSVYSLTRNQGVQSNAFIRVKLQARP